MRIEALPEASRHLLRFLAAAGRPVLGGLLGAAAGATDDVVSAAMREAVGQHVVSVSEDQHFRFRHALFGEAVYDDLLPGERSECIARSRRHSPAAGSRGPIGEHRRR